MQDGRASTHTNRNDASASAPRARNTGAHPEPLQRLVDELQRLPGIGRRTAERLAFHVLKAPAQRAHALARALEDVKQAVKHCEICWHLTQTSPCQICADSRRDQHTIMVVEQPRDLLALEDTGAHHGVYHVLMGRISPLDGVGPKDITVDALFRRIDHPDANSGAVAVREVILALNPNLEGDGTALYIADQLQRRKVRVTRLARGVPAGALLEFINKAVLTDAIAGRQTMEE